MANKKPLQWWVFLGSGYFMCIVYGNYFITNLIGGALVTYGMGLGIIALIKKIKAKK